MKGFQGKQKVKGYQVHVRGDPLFSCLRLVFCLGEIRQRDTPRRVDKRYVYACKKSSEQTKTGEEHARDGMQTQECMQKWGLKDLESRYADVLRANG